MQRPRPRRVAPLSSAAASRSAAGRGGWRHASLPPPRAVPFRPAATRTPPVRPSRRGAGRRRLGYAVRGPRREHASAASIPIAVAGSAQSRVRPPRRRPPAPPARPAMDGGQRTRPARAGRAAAPCSAWPAGAEGRGCRAPLPSRGPARTRSRAVPIRARSGMGWPPNGPRARRDQRPPPRPDSRPGRGRAGAARGTAGRPTRPGRRGSVDGTRGRCGRATAGPGSA